MTCSICPRKCQVDRVTASGFCGMGMVPVVAKAFLHLWEEPCISGNRGSGTVFFTGCNLKCVYCQNYRISQENTGREIPVSQLARIFMSLQNKGAHNINLVNPTHFIPQIKEAVKLARGEGLHLPVVYNSNGYESVEGLVEMQGVVDIYLPDLKYFHAETAFRYSGATDYFEVVSIALKEMYRQTGSSVLDPDGIMQRGMIVRHLVLPGLASESVEILRWIRENLPDDTYVSVMSQYIPFYNARRYPEIDRPITRAEYEKVCRQFFKLGFENGFVQERESAREEYVPDFDLEGLEDE